MGPETERRSGKLVLGLPAKEKMRMFERSESKVVRDAMSGDLCTSMEATKRNDVAEKQNINMPVSEGENPDVNVTDGVNLCEGGNGNETEAPSGSSSSFNDTVSGGDGGLGMSDDEISSEFHGVSQAAWDYPGLEEAFRTRKKKVTTHWRNFIRPLMWRCKWAELQMRKFQIQASMYSRLLEEFDQARQTQKENFNAEAQCSRTVPFPHQMKCRKIMRRTKRKRVEDTTDASSYMLQHNLFAYFENNVSSTDYTHLTNEFANPVIPVVRNGGVILDNDEALVQFDDEETSLQQILAKIDFIQSRVRNLTTRVDNVTSVNHGRFSFLDKMSLLTTPSDSGASTAPDPTAAPSDEDKVFITSPSTTTQPAFEHDVGEANMLEISVTVPRPDVLEGADHPIVANKPDDAEEMMQLKEFPITKGKFLVYTRAKKRKTLSEKQSNINSSVPLTQNERSSVFLASRITALQNNQKKRGNRKRANPVKKTFGES